MIVEKQKDKNQKQQESEEEGKTVATFPQIPRRQNADGRVVLEETGQRKL